MPLLNEHERGIVNSVKTTIDNINTTISEHDDFLKSLREPFASLKKELCGFDSELFIVTTIGMLKSGKSTLVNLLARSKLASPTGYGCDTTLRPALIMSADERKPDGSVEVWLPTNTNEFQNSSGKSEDDEKESEEKDSRKVLFDDVFLYLRGAGGLPAKAKPKEYELNSDILTSVLCKKAGQINELPQEPIIVVVKVPKTDGALISDKVVLLDTPGLDSFESDWTNSGWYDWLVQKSDLVIFLQSSVAPLNNSAAEILKSFGNKNRFLPIWLVQNEMEAKHWLTEEALKNMNERQRLRAIENFRDLCELKLPNYAVNLGKATPKILQETEKLTCDPDQLLENSYVKTLQDAMKESLDVSAVSMRKVNCKSRVRGCFEEAKNKTIECKKDQIEKKREELENQEKELVEEFEQLKGYISGDSTPSSIRPYQFRADDLEPRDDKKDEWTFPKNKFDSAVSHRFNPTSDEKFKVKALNEFKTNQEQAFRKHFTDIYNNGLDINDFRWRDGANGAEYSRLSDKIDREFKNFLENVFSHLKMKNFKREKMGSLPRTTTKMTRKTVKGRPDDWELLEVYAAPKEKRWLIMEKPRTATESRNHIKDHVLGERTLSAHLERKWDEEVRIMKNELAAWANEQINRMRTTYIENLEKFLKEEMMRISEKEATLNGAEDLLNSVSQNLEKAETEFGKLDNKSKK